MEKDIDPTKFNNPFPPDKQIDPDDLRTEYGDDGDPDDPINAKSTWFSQYYTKGDKTSQSRRKWPHGEVVSKGDALKKLFGKIKNEPDTRKSWVFSEDKKGVVKPQKQ